MVGQRAGLPAAWVARDHRNRGLILVPDVRLHGEQGLVIHQPLLSKFFVLQDDRDPACLVVSAERRQVILPFFSRYLPVRHSVFPPYALRTRLIGVTPAWFRG